MEDNLKTLMDEGISVGTRIAEALEKLVNEPLIEITPAPPVCPHCGRINPEIQTRGGNPTTGLMSHYVMEAVCISCGGEIYAITRDWKVAGKRSELLAMADQIENEERTASFNGRSSDS